MYKLFTKRFENQHAVIRPAGFELIQRTYQREIAKIIDYYHSRVYAVPSNHLLCRMLITGLISSELPMDRFMEIAYARSPYVAKHFNLTSEISYGRMFDGVFYGEGNNEILLYSEEYFDPYEALVNWRNLEPVKVLEHSVSDFGLKLPNGERNSTGQDLCVISINLPMLLVQYRGFMVEQSRSSFAGNGALSENHFVHMYVLPNMLRSHAELVILNRLKNLFYGAPMTQALTHHPFNVIDYGQRLDAVLKQVLKSINSTARPYAQYLQTIPSFYEESMQQYLQMPDLAKTRQVWWALFLTRLPVMQFLLDSGGENGLTANGTYISKLKIDVKQLKRESVMASVLPKDLSYDVSVAFEEILAL